MVFLSRLLLGNTKVIVIVIVFVIVIVIDIDNNHLEISKEE